MKLLIKRIELALRDIEALEEIDSETALAYARHVLSKIDELLSNYPESELQKARDIKGQKALNRLFSYQ